MNFNFSIIIPVYNRPEELDDLLQSIVLQRYHNDFEVVVIDDGSSVPCGEIIEKYKDKLNLVYHYKENTGPGDSRNYGMKRARGNYFIILDSDCILPKQYLKEVAAVLTTNYTGAYGGPDASDSNFTKQQKAISYAMTAFLTTGGIRGNKKLKKFQPRSFNMGLSKEAFKATGGFSKMNYGEDIDLSFRLWQQNIETQYIDKAFVYHKRRTTWKSFYKQVFNFGAARPVLNRMYPGTAKITYWFPTLFLIYAILALILWTIGTGILLVFFIAYLLALFVDSLFKNRNLQVALQSVLAALIMFTGYGSGFLRSQFRLKLLGMTKERSFPEMFSKKY
ncbi:MAG: glycosyltransferase [Flavobacteriaceae bacterium]|nr:glycosyltransferase [Flavobacteriaceae bacterium]